MKAYFIGILKTIGWSALVIWCLLSALVLIFLLHRWFHPGQESISEKDLFNYGILSLWLLGFFAASRLVLWGAASRHKQ